MISLVQISETAQGLVLAYPRWSAIALAAAAATLLALAFVRATRVKRRWPFCVAVVFAAWAAIYAATYRVNVSDDAAHAYAFMRFDHTVRWNDAADIYLEQRDGAGKQIVVTDRARRLYVFDVAELSREECERVLAYMVARMPAGSLARAPQLMRRHAAPAVRPPGSFGDQRI
jgi:hypothetical protein